MPSLYPYQNKMYHKFSDNLNNWIPRMGFTLLCSEGSGGISYSSIEGIKTQILRLPFGLLTVDTLGSTELFSSVGMPSSFSSSFSPNSWANSSAIKK